MIVGDLETSIFETAWYLTGLEKFLIDMLSDRQYINPLLDRIMNINIETGKRLIELGAEIIWCGDDFGSQHGMIMDPQLWRKIFKPRINEMFTAFRSVNNYIKIAWHSCGSIVPIIPDFIELGVQILNPVHIKATSMEPAVLKRDFGDVLTFWGGGVDTQDTLPHGTPQQVKDEVRRNIETLAPGGGYVFNTVHNIQADVPVENIVAMYKTLREYSFY